MVEFKQGTPTAKIADTVAAFSNSDGGVLLLGVKGDGEPVGLTIGPETERKVHGAVRTLYSPGRYDIAELDVDGRAVIVLSVARRHSGVAQTSDGRVLIRLGASNVAAIGDQLQALTRERALELFESAPTDELFAAASPSRVQAVAGAWGWKADGDVRDRLVEHGLVTGSSDGDRLTLAGSLYLLERAPARFAKACVEIFRYADQSDRYEQRTKIEGPLDAQVREAARIVAEEVGFDLVVLGLNRHELPRVPDQVLREAIANAVAHRDYANAGASIRIEIRPDAVIVRSPGSLPEPVTLANIREQNAARNPAIIDTLRRFGLAEDAGRGIDVMEDAMAENMLEAPEYRENGGFFEVRLSLMSHVLPEERAWIDDLQKRGHLTPDGRRILVQAARDSELTNSAVRELLGADSTRARAELQGLRDAGYLEQHGSRGGATYTLVQDLSPTGSQKRTREALLDAIVELAAGAPVTNATVRERFGVDRVEARLALQELVKSDRLERRGERRGTKYVAR